MIRKVVVMKNLPSNIFEEATFVLKDGVNIDVCEESNIFKTNSILLEAENLLEKYINKYENIEAKNKSFIDKIINRIKKV